MIYKTVAIRAKVYKLINDSEIIYRKAHKEFDSVPLSKNKILFEICKFYLHKTELEVKDDLLE